MSTFQDINTTMFPEDTETAAIDAHSLDRPHHSVADTVSESAYNQQSPLRQGE